MRYPAREKRLSTKVMHLEYLQRVLNGEANYGRQIVTISSTDGKIISYARPEYPARKGSDASAESGSEVEDVTSPTASRNLITHPILTPVHEEASG